MADNGIHTLISGDGLTEPPTPRLLCSCTHDLMAHMHTEEGHVRFEGDIPVQADCRLCRCESFVYSRILAPGVSDNG